MLEDALQEMERNLQDTVLVRSIVDDDMAYLLWQKRMAKRCLLMAAR